VGATTPPPLEGYCPLEIRILKKNLNILFITFYERRQLPSPEKKNLKNPMIKRILSLEKKSFRKKIL